MKFWALGSTRAVTNAAGTVCFSADYYPYGQKNAWCASRMALRDDYDASCSPTYKFTGYEYDSETGDYYAYARYYSPRLGRFMSPGAGSADIGNPQTLNRYAYVTNNPTSVGGPFDFPAVYLPSTNGSARGFAAAIIATTARGGSGGSAALTWAVSRSSANLGGSAPLSPAATLLHVQTAIAQGAEFIATYVLSFRPPATSPYPANGFDAACQALGASMLGSAGLQGCGLYIPASFTLSQKAGAIEAYYSLPSATGTDLALATALDNLYLAPAGFSAESFSLGMQIDPSFPSLDVGMFFGGGGGDSQCGIGGWNDMCSL